jgi:hypothetical protein
MQTQPVSVCGTSNLGCLALALAAWVEKKVVSGLCFPVCPTARTKQSYLRCDYGVEFFWLSFSDGHFSSFFSQFRTFTDDRQTDNQPKFQMLL